jgi:anti-anti-sigma factor
MQIKAKVFDRAKRVHAVRVIGDIHAGEIRQITHCLNAVLESKARHIIFSFDQCDWITAYFVRVLFSFYFYIRRCGGNFIIVTASEELTKSLFAYGLGGIIPIIANEIDAFDMVYDPQTEAGVDDQTRATLMERVEAAIEHESTNAPTQRTAAGASEEEGESKTIVMPERQEDGALETLEDLDKFEATVEMSLEEMGLLGPPEEAESIGTVSDVEISAENDISTGENAVQFLEVGKLSLDKNTDYERQIREKSDRYSRDPEPAATTRHLKPVGRNLTSLDLLPRGREDSSSEPLRGLKERFDGNPFSRFLNMVPEGPIAAGMQRLLSKTVKSLNMGNDVVAFVDARVQSAGYTGWLLKLMEEGCITGLVMTLNAGLKDFEATFGVSGMERADEVLRGTFGISEETFALFRGKAGESDIDLNTTFRELATKNTGPVKENSLLYAAMSRDMWTVFTVSEHGPLSLNLDILNPRNMAVNSFIGLLTGESAPVLLLPGTGASTREYVMDIIHIISNKRLSADLATIGCFREEPDLEFDRIVSSCGVDAVPVPGDPGFLFPFFAESLLTMKGDKV